MKRVVIIGGSFGAVLVANHLVNQKDVEVTIISPDDKMLYIVGTPRLLTNPKLINDAIGPLNRMIKGPFKLVKGWAKKVDPTTNSVIVSTTKGDEVVKYDFLVVASGASAGAPYYKPGEVSEATDAIKRDAKILQNATRVAVVGGGSTGVETVSEIAESYKTPTIDLYNRGERVLSALNPKRQRSAVQQLQKLNVNVLDNTIVEDLTPTSLRVGNETRNYDIVINAAFMKPNSSFLPKDFLDKNGYLKVNEYFVTKKDNIFGYGDICSITSKTLIDVNFISCKIIRPTLDKYVLGKNVSLKAYSKATSTTLLVPISSKGGVGELFGWGAPGFFIRMKSKEYLIPKFKKELL